MLKHPARHPSSPAAPERRSLSLCDRVREVCPEFPGHPDLIHWSIPDPARESDGDGDEHTYPAFERTADELSTRVAFLLELIEHTHTNLPRR